MGSLAFAYDRSVYLRTEIFEIKFYFFQKSPLYWIVGDAPLLWNIHKDKLWTSNYSLLKIFESLLRGFGQVRIFNPANNFTICVS